jgi:hypothetical protein
MIPGLILVASITVGCGTGTGCSDGPGMDNVVAGVTRWVRAMSVPESVDGQAILQASVLRVPVAADKSEGSPRVELITIHSSFLPGIRDGLAGNKAVFLAFTGTDSGSGAQVYYVIVRGADGSHHFVGECAAGGEQLFRDRFDRNYDATIDSIIGLTDRARISHILHDSRSSPTSSAP